MPKRSSKSSKPSQCPICGEPMDLFCKGNKAQPFVDGKTYPKICFCCFHVPKTYEQKYDNKGNIVEEYTIPYSHKSLHTAKELVEEGPAEDMNQARKSIRGVRAAIKKSTAAMLRKPKKKPKDSDTDINC